MKTIAHIRTPFPTKFGIPRQSGLVPEIEGRIIFAPPYRDPDALRGIEGFSHLWLLWEFSQTQRETWSPTVRPPRLGGNTRLGVFATRSPFRPNPIGLSCVRLLRVEWETPQGPVLVVAGADLMDGTPLYDIKPYLGYVDAHPEAVDGFAAPVCRELRHVVFPEALLSRLPEPLRAGALGMLAQDPRPAYQADAGRVYGVPYAGFDIRFTVSGQELTVCDVQPWSPEPSSQKATTS